MPQFTKDSARQIAGATRRVGKAPRSRVGRPSGPVAQAPFVLGITTTTLTARSGKTPGFGTVQPYYFNGSTLVLGGAEVTVFNWTGSVIAANKWVKFGQLYGYRFFNGNDCSGVAP